MADKLKSNIGAQFNTPKNGTLTVKAYDETSNKFILECSICSKDEELWPYGSIQSPIRNLKSGKTPCACSRASWKEWQYRIIINRLCNEIEYIFHGWSSEFKGNKTKLSLENPVTGNKWDSCDIAHFLEGRRDPVAGFLNASSIRRRSPDDYIKQLYESNLFIEGTIFEHTDKVSRFNGNYYSVHCPICSRDEYVLGGVCNGKFYATITNLLSGKRPCRCAKNYRYTKEQKEWKIKQLCDTCGYTWLGWEVEGKNNARDYINILCDKGHEIRIQLFGFMSGNKCNVCALEDTGFNGFYKNRVDDDDFLYVMVNEDNNIVKCGRSFVPDKRLPVLKGNSGIDFKIIELYTSKHLNVYHREQEIKEIGYTMGQNYYPEDYYIWAGSTECYRLRFTEEILAYLNSCDDLQSINLKDQ